MARTKDGWAVLLPYEYQGEDITKVSAAEIPGAYQLVDSTNTTHRKETRESPWEDIIVPTQYIRLNADGTITGARDYDCTITNAHTASKSVSGTWKLIDGGAYAEFKLGDVTYSGVFTKQKDESAEGKEVIVFTAAGSDNSTIWGAQHFAHVFDTTATANATLSKDGRVYTACSLCGEAAPNGKISVINRPAVIKLNTTKYTYSGDAFKPAVTVKDAKGNTVPATNYTVTYSNNKNVGTASAKIVVKGNYSGTKTLNFTINPKNTSITKLTAVKRGFKVNIKKYTTQTTGYQVQYSTSKTFKSGNKTVTLGNKTTTKTITKLKGKKKYYVRIRTYRKAGGKKYYSAWSKSKSVTTKSSVKKKKVATSSVSKQNTPKTVYITPTGKRYHYSKECAGKNAIKTDIKDAKKDILLAKSVLMAS